MEHWEDLATGRAQSLLPGAQSRKFTESCSGNPKEEQRALADLNEIKPTDWADKP